MGNKETRLLARESVYWVNMGEDSENAIKQCAKYIEYQQTQPQLKTMPYEVPYKPWEMVVADIFC